MNITVRADDVAVLNQSVLTCDERLLLKQLRDETTLLVLLVREDNDRRKAQEQA